MRFMKVKTRSAGTLFHSSWAAAIAFTALCSSQVMADDGRGGKPCSNLTIRGDYGIQMQGTRNTPPPNVVTETVIGVLIRKFDGYGNFEQVDNVKGSVSGTVPDRPGAGTYEVSADCTGSTYFQPDPNNPNLIIKEKIVIVNNGNQILAITQSPPTLMVSTVATRVQKR